MIWMGGPKKVDSDASGLVPCPFCSHKAEWWSDGERLWVQCSNLDCAARGPQPRTMGEAQKAWNARLYDPPEWNWKDTP